LSGSTKAIILACLAVVSFALLHRATRSFDPPLPGDMPADARFLSTGYDLDKNERKGNWVACHEAPPGSGQRSCRVADSQGMVIFEGIYLPVRDAQSVAAAAGQIAPNGKLGWVTGPSEGLPVPVIPMTDGSVLVPQGDRDALVDRWARDPEEWRNLTPAK